MYRSSKFGGQHHTKNLAFADLTHPLIVDTVGLLRINEPTDKTIVLEFRDFVPALHEVSMDWMTLPWGGVYRGELIMQLNGYLHTDVAIPRRQPRRKGRTT